ncbi:MAG: hypothetical protein QOD36_937 [Mycobacterium sp.]|jgi:uncharacterized protein (TIGR00369 family)|nr:hypothetical protein [Mycobacterium sp.]
MGLIPGGALAILADSALAAAIGTALPANTGLVTSELSLRFLRPVSAGGHLVAHGTLVHVGRSIGLSHVRITDGQGRLIADGSSMCFIKPLPPPADGAGQPYEDHEDQFVADLGLAQLDPWQRPALGQVLSQDVWDRMSGLEIFQALIDDLTGNRVMEASEGNIVFAMPAHKWLTSPQRTVQGVRWRARLVRGSQY